MFFSIIVPIYNVEKYLGECIDSILAQTFKDFELILVDDGSPDSSGEICEAYKEKDARIIVIHKKNGGLSDSRNFGTRAAKGQYIVYIDSDDYLSKDTFLQQLFETAKGEPDIILYKYKKYFEASKTFSEVGFHIPQISASDNKADIIKKLVAADAFYCAAWMKAVKRELIVENKIEFKTGIVSEDQEWYYHIILATDKIAAIDEAFIIYRQRPGSITSTTGDKNILDTIALLKYWSNRISSTDISNDEKEAIFHSFGKLYANLLIAYASLNWTARKTHQQEMRDLIWLLRYDLNPRTKKINRLRRIFGFYGLVLLVAAVQKIRRR